MKVIGITGGIGSGKSTVLEYLRMVHQARVIQADEIGHQVMEPGEECYAAICSLFGLGILNPDGQINRKELAGIVFNDKTRLEQLNAIVHPAVKKRTRELVEEMRKEGAALCLVEAALLLEAGFDEFCDETWYIYADPEVRIQRLMEYRHETREKALRVMKQQLSDEYFRRHTDFTIDNSDNFDITKMQIESRLETLH